MLDASNSLAVLAARINTEHDAAEAAKGAAVVAARKGIEHAIAAGELLLEAKAHVSHGQWLPWLAENCPTVSPRMAQYYMGLARKRPELESKCETVSHLTLREAVQLLNDDDAGDTPAEDKAGPNGHGDEWYTPPEYVELVRDLFGGVIDLDPASCEEAQQTVQAKRYYTKEDDGLKQPWRGRVLLNPTYSNPTPFVDKLIEHHEAGDVPDAILLENTDSSARWFHKALRACSAICFPSSRIKFRHGLEVCSPRYSSLLFYFGGEVEQFRRLFASIGTVVIVKAPDNSDHRQMTVIVEFV